MSEEIITTPTPEVVTTQSNVAANLDSELDAALAKSFKNVAPKEEKNETPKPEVKEDKAPPQKEITIDLKKPAKEVKEVAKETKPIEEDKPLPNPDDISASPEGKGQAAWNALKGSYKRSFKTIETKDQEITKLKATLAEKTSWVEKETQALKKEIEELSKYRAMVDIQADPEFVSKFDQPIENTIQSLKGLFKVVRDKTTGNPIGEEVINALNFNNTAHIDSIIDIIEANGDKTTAARMRGKMVELVNLNDKRLDTLSEQKNNYKQLLENKKKESFTKGAETEGKMIKHLENISLGKDRNGEQKYNPIVFLNKQEITDGLTQPQIDQINNHNAMVDGMQKMVKDAMKLEAPEDRMDLIVAAVASNWLQAENKSLKAKLASVEESLKKVSVVNSETEKVKTPTTRNGNGQHVGTEEALNSFFGRR